MLIFYVEKHKYRNFPLQRQWWESCRHKCELDWQTSVLVSYVCFCLNNCLIHKSIVDQSLQYFYILCFNFLWVGMLLVINDNNGITYCPTPAKFKNSPNWLVKAYFTHSNYCGKGILAIPLTPQRDNFDIFKKCFDGKKSKP